MDSCHGESNSLVPHTADKALSTHIYPTNEPELLGSVTHNQELDGSNTGLQIRSSARVSKKMRLDSSISASLPVTADKKDDEKPDKPEKVEKSEKADKNDTKQHDVKPKRRPWELWSQEDKNTFFEALNEFGKDFDAIQNHFATKARRKGLSEHMIKNKDQVRHFFYRTWHKISKHLKFSDDIKNATKELYGLVNYGEMRKKIGYVTEKICMKLNELVYKGTVQIRIKGKTFRIKTPLCRALRKLNQLEECQDDLKLPARVLIELRPRHNSAWARVQATSQNPRIRTLLPLQRRLTSLLAFLNQRWRPPAVKHRDKLLMSADGMEMFSQVIEDRKKEKDPLLRVAPRSGVTICVPNVNLTEYLTSSSLSLISYEERFANRIAGEAMAAGKGVGKGCVSKKGGKRQRVDSASDKKNAEVCVPVVKQKDADSEIASVQVAENVCDSESTTKAIDDKGNITCAETDINDMAINKILSLQHCSELESENGIESNSITAVSTDAVVSDIKEEPKNEPAQASPQEPKVEDNEEIINNIRAGWTIEDANTLTIGELYLMFGCDSKLQLEYWWEESVKASANANCIEEADKIVADPTTKPLPGPLAETLLKLVSIAKLNSTNKQAKVACPCGHICGSSGKPGVSSRRPPQPKVTQEETSTSQSQTSTPAARSAVSVNVTALHDGVFRRPLLAPSHFKPLPKPGTVEAFKAQLDKFRPRYCNRRGRAVRPKNVVVQRMLPLLPKAPNGRAMVTLKVIPQTSQLSGEFMPISSAVTTKHSQPTPLLPRLSKNHQILSSSNKPVVSTESGCGTLPVQANSSNSGGLPDLGQDSSPVILQSNGNSSSASSNVNIPEKRETVFHPSGSGMHINLHKNGTNRLATGLVNNPANNSSSSGTSGVTSSLLSSGSASPPLNTPVASPPSISNLLELSLPSTVGEELALVAGTSGELLDVPIQDHTTASQPSFEGLLPAEGVAPSTSTPPTSPSRILKEGEDDHQWLNAEVADFSLSSFLGHLESPLKPPSTAPATEDTRLSSDVEAQLQCLMSESSVDYMAKFADLAAQIASDGSSKK